MKTPNNIDPALLKRGDRFRGKYWKNGKDHIYKEIITLDNKKKQMLVVSECNYWFDPFNIYEPSSDKKNNCPRCEINYKKKHSDMEEK